MYVDKVLGRIELIQEATRKDLDLRLSDWKASTGLPKPKLKPIHEVMEPGTTGFKPKKGSVLLSAVEVPFQQSSVLQVKTKDVGLEEFNGVYPMIGIVFETNSEQYKAGDVVLCEMAAFNTPTIAVNGCTGIVLHESLIIGVDSNLM